VGEVFDALQEEFALNAEAGFFGEGLLHLFTHATADDFPVFPYPGASRDARHLPVVNKSAAVTILLQSCQASRT
jgi:hypothetical protein